MKNRTLIRNSISKDLSTDYFKEEHVVVTFNSSVDETR